MLTTKEICFAISTFNCREELELCIKSLPTDSFIIQGDGAYPEFAEKWINDTVCRTTDLISSDGTNEVIHSLGRKGFVFSCPGPQVEKRQKIADKVAELGYRFMFVIDSDEFIHPDSDWNEFLSDLEARTKPYVERHLGMVFDVTTITDADYDKASNIIETGWDKLKTNPRIWLYPQQLEYFNNIHWWVRRKESNPKEIVTNRHNRLGSQIPIGGLKLYHWSSYRSERYLEARRYWAAKQLLSEKRAQNLYLGFPVDRRT
jgi:hypothetical protein